VRAGRRWRAAAVPAAVGLPTDEEKDVKSQSHHGSRRRGAAVERTPEDLARAHADALWWRARLRAGATSEVGAPPAAAPATAPADRRTAERARFAAAIARAEFGRFYDNGERPVRKRKPARNGKGDAS